MITPKQLIHKLRKLRQPRSPSVLRALLIARHYRLHRLVARSIQLGASPSEALSDWDIIPS